MQEGVNVYSDEEEHFGVPWKLLIFKKSESIAFHLFCLKSLEAEKWSIQTEFELKMDSKKPLVLKLDYTFGNEDEKSLFSAFGSPNFIRCDDLNEGFLIDNTLTAEAHVSIKKMTGFHGEKMRKFDETVKDVSDFEVFVGGKSFHVLKLFLAAQSTYFKSLLAGAGKNLSTWTILDIDADDFQKYLEVLYGDSAINESTVEGIVAIAKELETPSVVRRCEEFLVEKSKKTMKKKLQMAISHDLESLKTHCLGSMKSTADVRSLVPSDITQMDRSLIDILFQKMLTF